MAEDFLELPRGFRRPQAITDEEIVRVIRLHGQGMGRNQIMRETGLGAVTVSETCRQLGLSFDRTRVRAATAARVADAKLIRASLHIRLLESAEDDLDAMHAPVTVYNFGGRDNTYAEHEVETPSIEARLKLKQSAAIAIDRALKLADYDSDGGRDLPSVDRWLDAMTDGKIEESKRPPDAGTSEGQPPPG